MNTCKDKRQSIDQIHTDTRDGMLFTLDSLILKTALNDIQILVCAVYISTYVPFDQNSRTALSCSVVSCFSGNQTQRITSQFWIMHSLITGLIRGSAIKRTKSKNLTYCTFHIMNRFKVSESMSNGLCALR